MNAQYFIKVMNLEFDIIARSTSETFEEVEDPKEEDLPYTAPEIIEN